ncbi:purine-cytosine permease-like protein [Schumannella luteola]|uniref:Purine-cytosine permease-like protein n=1 Tax=Schumannella luteola TaxID=472059 RepID=A0A852YDA4_9MICO|nr:purine-cytosine permease-like protein [Schumannella luteola]
MVHVLIIIIGVATLLTAIGGIRAMIALARNGY